MLRDAAVCSYPDECACLRNVFSLEEHCSQNLTVSCLNECQFMQGVEGSMPLAVEKIQKVWEMLYGVIRKGCGHWTWYPY